MYHLSRCVDVDDVPLRVSLKGYNVHARSVVSQAKIDDSGGDDSLWPIAILMYEHLHFHLMC